MVMARDGRPLRTITTPAAKLRRRRDVRAAAGAALLLARRHEDRLRLHRPTRCPVASTCGSIQRSTFYTDANVDRGDADRRLRQPVQRLRPRVGDELAHARLRRLRQPGRDRRPRRRRLLQKAVDGPERRHGRRRAHARRHAARGHLRLRPEQEADVLRGQRQRSTEFPPAYPDFACETTKRRRALRRPVVVARRRRARVREQPRASRSRASRSSAPARARRANDLDPERDRLRARLGPAPTRPPAAYVPARRDAGDRRRRPGADRRARSSRPSRPRPRRSRQGPGSSRSPSRAPARSRSPPRSRGKKVASGERDGEAGRHRHACKLSKVKKTLKGKRLTLKLSFKDTTRDEEGEGRRHRVRGHVA